MRRTPGGIALITAGILLAVAVGMLWLTRVAFSPSTDARVAASILDDNEIRDQIATVVASADASLTGQSPLELREFIRDDIARHPDGAAILSSIVRDGHARVIGEHDEPVRISAEEQVQIVRDELVGEADPLTVPVDEVGSMAFLNAWLGWAALACVAVALLCVLGGVVLRPERGETSFAVGVGLASLAVSLFTFGYLVPAFLLPMLSDDIWMGLFSGVASHRLATTLLLAALSLAAAALVVFGTHSRRQHRQHSTPLNVARYREARTWSR